MNFLHLRGHGYVPTYQRNEITDKLHQTFGFRTDNEIIPTDLMKKILINSKK